MKMPNYGGTSFRDITCLMGRVWPIQVESIPFFFLQYQIREKSRKVGSIMEVVARLERW